MLDLLLWSYDTCSSNSHGLTSPTSARGFHHVKFVGGTEIDKLQGIIIFTIVIIYYVYFARAEENRLTSDPYLSPSVAKLCPFFLPYSGTL